MSLRQIGLAFLFVLVLGGLFTATTSADTDYTIDIIESSGVTTVETPNSVSVTEDDTLTLVEPKTEIVADVTGPPGEEFTVYLRDNEANIVHWFSPMDIDGTDTVSLSTDGIGPGTYAVTSEANVIEAISPVVIEAFEIDTEGPTTESQEVSVTLDPYADDVGIDRVTLVAWDGSDAERIEMAEDGDYSYTASVSDLASGEYEFQVIVYGEDEIADQLIGDLEDEIDTEIDDEDQNEMIALSDRWTGSVSEPDNGENGGSDDNGDVTSGNGGAPSQPQPGASDGENESSDSTSNESSPVATESVNISDGASDTSETTVEFEQTSVASISFVTDTATGTVTVTDYGATGPPSAPDMDNRPVLAGVEITVPEMMANQSATIHFKVNESRFSAAAVDPDEAVVLRATDGSYEPLETTVLNTSGQITLAAETPGFSVFVVSADETGTYSNESESSSDAEGNDKDGHTDESDNSQESDNNSIIRPSDNGTENDGETNGVSDDAAVESQTGFGIIPAAVALVIAITVSRRDW